MSVNDMFVIIAAIIFLIPCTAIGLTVLFVYLFNKGSKKNNSQLSCPNCNQMLSNDTAYCPNCGKQIEKRN